MKWFVTGRSSNIEKVVGAFSCIEAAGHTITLRWTDLPMIKPYDEHPETASIYSSQQILGIEQADVFVLFAHQDGNGVFTEFGAALAYRQLRGTPLIYAIGDENVKSAAMFHFHPAIVWRNSIEEVLAELA